MTTDGAGPPASPEAHLARRLGLGSATALVVGEVIGVGIFLTPAGMARSLGSPALLLAVWLTMGVVALAGALTFGGLAARYPEVGGIYAFLRRAYGPKAAFLYGWQSLLVTDPGITAALGAGLATYAASFVPLTSVGQKAVAIGAIFALAAANAAGLGIGAGLLRTLAAAKVALLAAIAFWGFGMGLGDWSNFLPIAVRRPGSETLGLALAGGMVSAFFSFGGWWDLSKLAGEVREPRRNVPLAMVLGLAVVTVVYVLISAVFLYLVPLTQVESGSGFAAQVGQALFGRTGERIFAGVVIVTVLGSLAANLMAAPRVYVAMARDGLFPSALAAVHPRLGTPARAIGVQAVLAALLVASGGFEQILAYFIATTIAFLALTATAAYRVGGEGPDSTPARIPGYPITPLLFVVPTVLLIALMAAKEPKSTALGLGVVILGLPFYRLTASGRPSAKAASQADLDPAGGPVASS